MNSYPPEVHIVEVGPRDGLQNQSTEIATDTKVEWIERLARAGLPEIEATSFVRGALPCPPRLAALLGRCIPDR